MRKSNILTFLPLLALGLFVVVALSGSRMAALGARPAEKVPQLAQESPSLAAAASKFQFPQELVDRVTNMSESAQGSYSGYMRLTDDFEAMTVFVPNEWQDIQTGDWLVQGKKVGNVIEASSDLNRFKTSHDVPGVFVGASRVLAAQYSGPALLDLRRGEAAAGCEYRGQMHFTDAFYLGDYDYSMNCGAEKQNVIVAAAKPPNGDHVILIQIVVKSKADLDAAAHVLSTFQVIGDLDAGDH
ncbi:MAG: hypothetical protein ABI670_04580 [Chloroflexota bacterium]